MLVALDFDGALTTTDPFVGLAEQAGTGSDVSELRERQRATAGNGGTGLEAVAGRLSGLSVDEDPFDRLEVRADVPGLLTALDRAGHETAVISDGPKRAVRSCLDSPESAVDTVVANRLPTENGAFTGEIAGPLVDRRKDETLKQLAIELEQPLVNTVAVGTDRRDLPMVRAAGLGIGLDPDPAVEPACDGVAPSISGVERLLEEDDVL